MAFMFWRRRAARQRGLQWGLGAIVLTVTFGISVAAGFAARQPDIGVRSALRDASAEAGSVVWERRTAQNASAQDTEVRARLKAATGDAPVTISTVTVGDPLSLDDPSVSVLPMQDDAALRAAVHDAAVLATGETAVDTVSARALGLEVGDTLRLRTDAGVRSLRIVAVWQAIDPAAPIWNGIGPGASGTGPRLLLAPAELRADGIELSTRWAVAPDPSRIRADQLSTIENGWRQLASRASASSSTFTRFEGGGIETLAGLRSAVAASAAVVPVPIALLSAAGLLAFGLLLVLRAELAADETLLLRARGASRRQLARGELRAITVPVAVGAVVGSTAAQLSLVATLAPPNGWAEVLLPLLVPPAAALCMIPALSATPESGDGASRRGPGRRGLALGGVLLALALAVVGVLRLIGAGVGSDPASALAPALVIVALVVLGLVAGLPAAAGFSRAVRRADGVALPLAARRLLHRPGLIAGPVVLISLAVATCGFASATIASSSGYLRDAGRVTTGGDVSVHTGVASRASSLERIAEVNSGVPALVQDVGLGDLPAVLSAAPLVRLAGMQDAALARLDLLAPTAGPVVGLALPATRELWISVDVASTSAPSSASVELTGWFVRTDGSTAELVFGSTPIRPGSAQTAFDARLPATADWRWIALDATVQSPAAVTGLTVEIASMARLSTTGQKSIPLPATPWKLVDAIDPARGTGARGTIGWSAAEPLDAAGGLAELGRIMPGGSAVVPVALARPLAATAGLRVGDRAQLDSDPSLSIQVVAIVPHTVGTRSVAGIWTDLSTLQTAALRTDPDGIRPDRVWLTSTGDPRTLAARIAAEDPSAIVAVSPAVDGALLGRPAVVALQVGAAGALIFALVGIGAAVAALLRTRRPETVILRALGADALGQRAAARVELLAGLVFAAVVGAVTATVVVLVTVPVIAHAADAASGSELQAALRLDPVLTAIAVLVLLLGAIGGVLILVRAVARVATTPDGGGVDR